jgi:hypothetical protein
MMSSTVSRGYPNIVGLGLWTAPNPWGPWEQIYEELPWRPGGDANASPYQPQIAPKWIAPDGRSFWLVWSDCRFPMISLANAEIELRKKHLKSLPKIERDREELAIYLRYLTSYAFNAQRVDLDVV